MDINQKILIGETLRLASLLLFFLGVGMVIVGLLLDLLGSKVGINMVQIFIPFIIIPGIVFYYLEKKLNEILPPLREFLEKQDEDEDFNLDESEFHP